MDFLRKIKITDRIVLIVGILCFLWVLFLFSYVNAEVIKQDVLGIDKTITGKVTETAIINVKEAQQSPDYNAKDVLTNNMEDGVVIEVPEDRTTVSVNQNDYALTKDDIIVLAVESVLFEEALSLEAEEKSIIDSTYNSVDKISKEVNQELPFTLPKFSPNVIEKSLDKTQDTELSKRITFSPRREPNKAVLVGVVEKTGEAFDVIATIENGEPRINFAFGEG